METSNTIIQGLHKSGKTTYCKKIIKESKQERILILDFANEYTEFPLLDNESFINNPAMVGVFRIDLSNMSLYEVKNKVLIVVNWFSKGLLILDDINKIFNGIFPTGFISVTSTNRTFGIDIVMTTVNPITNPKILGNTDTFIHL